MRGARLPAALLAGAGAAGMASASASTLEPVRAVLVDPGSTFVVSSVIGLAVFAVTTAFFYVRERNRWEAREAELGPAGNAAQAAQEAELFAAAGTGSSSAGTARRPSRASTARFPP